MKVTKDRRIFLFITLAVIIAGVTIFNIYMNNKIDKAGELKQLEVANQALKEENNNLTNNLKNVLPSSQEQERQEYLSLVKKFINLSFYKEKNGYEERREQAKNIMSDELFQQFYPTPTYEYGEEFSSKPNDMDLYLQSHNPNKDIVKVIVEFTNETTDKKQEKTEKTRNFIKVTAQKINGNWRVINVEELDVKII